MISLYSKVMGYHTVFPLPILHTFLDVENVNMNDYAVDIHAKLSAYRDYTDNFILKIERNLKVRAYIQRGTSLVGS